MIHYAVGTGGFFLSAVFAKIMNIPNETVISSTGHCHNLGTGDWTETKHIWVAHQWDDSINAMKFIYRPGVDLYSTHVIDPQWVKENPDIQVIQIGADTSDYASIIRLGIKKAFASGWTKEEYDKWYRPEYPPYSPDNVIESELICQDLLNGFMPATTEWYNQYSKVNYAHIIKFKTVMGLNDQSLVDEVSRITGCPVNDHAREFVDEYQQLNLRLYFDQQS